MINDILELDSVNTLIVYLSGFARYKRESSAIVLQHILLHKSQEIRYPLIEDHVLGQLATLLEDEKEGMRIAISNIIGHIAYFEQYFANAIAAYDDGKLIKLMNGVSSGFTE